MSWLTNLENAIQKDEEWVVAEIRKGWALVQSAEHKAEVDVLNVFHWISTHQAGLQSLVQTVLTDISVVAPLVPSPYGPAVATVTTALNAGMIAINRLAAGIQQGSTPMSTLSNAYVATKDAATAVNAFLKAATTQPAPAPAQ